MKKLIIIICAALMLCFAGCGPKDNKLSANEKNALMDLLSSNNPYREADSITQLDFNKADMRLDMIEKASATNWESESFVIKDIYHTDKDNVYKMDILYGTSMYELFITLVKSDATELILELPASSYKETYVPDRGLTKDQLIAVLSAGEGWESGLYKCKVSKNSETGADTLVFDNLETGDKAVYDLLEVTYRGIDIYEFNCRVSVNGGQQQDTIMNIKLTKDPTVINIKTPQDSGYYVASDFFRY